MPIAKHDCPIDREDEISKKSEDKIEEKISFSSQSQAGLANLSSSTTTTASSSSHEKSDTRTKSNTSSSSGKKKLSKENSSTTSQPPPPSSSTASNSGQQQQQSNSQSTSQQQQQPSGSHLSQQQTSLPSQQQSSSSSEISHQKASNSANDKQQASSRLPGSDPQPPPSSSSSAGNIGGSTMVGGGGGQLQPPPIHSSGSSSQPSSTSSTPTNKCTRLLFCGVGTSESKRKDVDESNVNGASGSGEQDPNQGSKGRKSFRKGSKKKDKSSSSSAAAAAALQERSITSGPGGDVGGGGGAEFGDIQLLGNNNDNNNNNNTIEASNNAQSAHDRSSNKSCCFCWCCCCSCSCPSSYSLSGKNGQSKSGKENNKLQSSLSFERCLNGNGEQPPSLEEIRLWAESFDTLMKCPWGRKVFRDFLKCEYSEENILFWLACEDLKKETNPDVIEERARIIYEDYVSILSPKEVSLDSRVREIINKNMVEPTSHTFDEAQLQIYTLMHRDSYPRFINSPIYRKLAQLPSPSRKGSSA